MSLLLSPSPTRRNISNSRRVSAAAADNSGPTPRPGVAIRRKRLPTIREGQVCSPRLICPISDTSSLTDAVFGTYPAIPASAHASTFSSVSTIASTTTLARSATADRRATAPIPSWEGRIQQHDRRPQRFGGGECVGKCCALPSHFNSGSLRQNLGEALAQKSHLRDDQCAEASWRREHEFALSRPHGNSLLATAT